MPIPGIWSPGLGCASWLALLRIYFAGFEELCNANLEKCSGDGKTGKEFREFPLEFPGKSGKTWRFLQFVTGKHISLKSHCFVSEEGKCKMTFFERGGRCRPYQDGNYRDFQDVGDAKGAPSRNWAGPGSGWVLVPAVFSTWVNEWQ